ncbi:PTS sugar transporter subunit IIA, partial [Vibrio vulnificus]
MVIEFSHGKIIVTPHEVVVRLQGSHSVTLNAQVDAVQLIG